MSLMIIGGGLFMLECWAALTPPHVLTVVPSWLRWYGLVVFVPLALFRPREQRGGVAVIGAVFWLMMNRERFSYGPWLNPVIWTGAVYVVRRVFLGATFPLRTRPGYGVTFLPTVRTRRLGI